MTLPLFSTIIATYNRADLLGRALESVLGSGAENQEVIVVDDGSTDGTRDLLASYGDRIQAVRQENGGPAAARNLGASRATGRYLSFLDSDDLRFSWTLNVYEQVIREHGEPAFIAGQPLVFRHEQELAGIRQEPLRVEAFADFYDSSDAWRWFSASSFVIRRDVFEEVGGFAAHRFSAEDCDLTMRLGTAPGFVHIVSPATFAYREHPTSMKANPGLMFCGLSYLFEQEQHGGYPGGAERRSERLAILSRHLRPAMMEFARQAPHLGWSLYRRTFRWHLRLGRWRFLVGFPFMTVHGRWRSAGQAANAAGQPPQLVSHGAVRSR